MQLDEYKEIAKNVRKDAINLTYQMGNTGAHIGGALSLVEIMVVLYLGVMNINPKNVLDEERDRLIFSKGHGTLALYPVMRYAGIISQEELLTYKQSGTFLFAHPSMNRDRGIEFSSGSLGQGLSLGVGCCLALKRKNNNTSKIYVVLGDGECNEGSIWEAAQSASHFECSNLIAIIDKNDLQYDGPTKEIMNDDNMGDKWRSFGWDVVECDGHSIEELQQALTQRHEKPLAVIAHTVKGKGISFMENNPMWHNHSLNEKQYRQAIEEIEKGGM